MNSKLVFLLYVAKNSYDECAVSMLSIIFLYNFEYLRSFWMGEMFCKHFVFVQVDVWLSFDDSLSMRILFVWMFLFMWNVNCMKCKHHFEWFINKMFLSPLQTELYKNSTFIRERKRLVDFEYGVINFFASWPKLISRMTWTLCYLVKI